MKVENGKIIEASESELWQYYLERDLDDVYSFADYLDRMKDAGVKIVEKKKTNCDKIDRIIKLAKTLHDDLQGVLNIKMLCRISDIYATAKEIKESKNEQ